MAKLSYFVRNAAAMAAGVAITVGPSGNEFVIVTRGLTATFRDRLSALQRDAAIELNRKVQVGAPGYSPDSLPPSVADRCQAQALIDECLTGIEGLENDDGSAVTFDDFKALLLDGSSRGLLALASWAAGRVGDEQAENQKAIEGN
ncbi:MAG: hypothetical protein ABF893_08870 [Gluconacetobacter liquefaciens]